jgi:hypothetical protein
VNTGRGGNETGQDVALVDPGAIDAPDAASNGHEIGLPSGGRGVRGATGEIESIGVSGHFMLLSSRRTG